MIGRRTMRAGWAALVLGGLAACRAGPPPDRVAVGDWVVTAHDDPATGRFGHCAVSARRNRGINLYVSMSALRALHLGFERESWRFAPGAKVPVGVAVDGQRPEPIEAEAMRPDFLWVYWADWTRPSMRQQALRVGRTLDLHAPGGPYRFDLVGLRPAVRALARCAAARMPAARRG